MNSIDELTMRMIELYCGDAARIQHFIKVHSLAKLIGNMSSLDHGTMMILECAALVHDIGIHECERLYGSCEGPLQEQVGPPMAHRMLWDLNFSQDIIERVCYLVGHHHTYDGIDGVDYQILVEADFLVNMIENDLSDDAIDRFRDGVFRTQAGLQLLACIRPQRL